MNLKELLNQGRLKLHKTSKEEISNLIKLIKRDIKDAKIKELSLDRRFATAYNAVLQSATILLYCCGYKPYGVGHHWVVFEAMKEILGKEYEDLGDYFDSCRAKRNLIDYTSTMSVSEKETEELINEAEKFLEVVVSWVKTNYPKLLK